MIHAYNQINAGSALAYIYIPYNTNLVWDPGHGNQYYDKNANGKYCA